MAQIAKAAKRDVELNRLRKRIEEQKAMSRFKEICERHSAYEERGEPDDWLIHQDREWLIKRIEKLEAHINWIDKKAIEYGYSGLAFVIINRGDRPTQEQRDE